MVFTISLKIGHHVKCGISTRVLGRRSLVNLVTVCQPANNLSPSIQRLHKEKACGGEARRTEAAARLRVGPKQGG